VVEKKQDGSSVRKIQVSGVRNCQQRGLSSGKGEVPSTAKTPLKSSLNSKNESYGKKKKGKLKNLSSKGAEDGKAKPIVPQTEGLQEAFKNSITLRSPLGGGRKKHIPPGKGRTQGNTSVAPVGNGVEKAEGHVGKNKQGGSGHGEKEEERKEGTLASTKEKA